MKRTVFRLPIAALSALTLLVALAPLASAAPSGADRLLAAGAGRTFSAPVATSSFSSMSCFTDAADDVVNQESSANPRPTVDEPRADIVDYCVDSGVSTVTLSLEVDSPTNPTTDVNWRSSLLGWFIDTDGSNGGDYFAQLSLDPDGSLDGSVEDRSTTPASEACEADASYASGTLTLSFPADCIDSPDEISVNPGLIYDQRVGSTTGVLVFDEAPENGLAGPVNTGGVLEDGIVRLAGGERIATAVEVSQALFEDGETDTVVLTRADEFPDALAGTPLAVELDAPILLTPTDTLSPLTAAEIDRVTDGSGTVVILGGELAVAASVASDLTAAGYDVVRYGGTNRFETAVEIATDGLGSPSTVLAADGGDFQDAIVAGTAASTVDGAVLLTDGATVPPATQAYLDGPGSDVTAIGASAAAALPDEDAVAGDDAIATSVLAAETYFPDATIVGVARVDSFPDALTGGALLANPDAGPGPILFVETDSLPTVVEAYITDNPIVTVVIFGGVDAVSQDVEDEIEALL